jgi:UDP-N-acetyl-D-mannosaminuronic acid dehydrogenase
LADVTHLIRPNTDGQVAVIGLGYVGLTLAVSIAKAGTPVFGVEVNPDVRAALAKRRATFFEPGVEELLSSLPPERFTVSDRLPDTPLWAVVICVGTAVDPHTKQPDLRHLTAAVDHVAQHVTDDTLVVVRSTVPVGISRQLVYPKLRERVEQPLLAFCPERTIQGQALAEIESLPQVIGGVDDRSVARARALFAPVAADHVVVSSIEAAEMVKLVCNSHTDLIYGFGNEVAMIAQALDLDGNEVIAAANLRYPRPDLSRPGFVGGSCLTKDPYLLTHSAEGAGYRPPMVAAARAVNERVPQVAVEQVLQALDATGCAHADAKVLVCGIAYKGRPETDDVRGSAAVDVANGLRERVAVLAGHDFVVAPERIAELGYEPVDLHAGMTDADAVVLLVDHPRYRDEIDTDTVRSRMRLHAVVFDMWGLLADELAEAEDVEYRRLGCGAADSRHRWSWVRRPAPGASPAA